MMNEKPATEEWNTEWNKDEIMNEKPAIEEWNKNEMIIEQHAIAEWNKDERMNEKPTIENEIS